MYSKQIGICSPRRPSFLRPAVACKAWLATVGSFKVRALHARFIVAQDGIRTRSASSSLSQMAATSIRSWIAQDVAGHELSPAQAQALQCPGRPAVPMGEAVVRTVRQARFLLVLHAPVHAVAGGPAGLLGALQQHVLAMWPDPEPPLPPTLTVLAVCLRTGPSFNACRHTSCVGWLRERARAVPS